MSPSKNMLFFSHEHWDCIWRRNQFIAKALHDRHPQSQILWIGPQTDLWTGKNVIPDREPLGCTYAPEVSMPRFHVLRPYKPLPNVIGRSVNAYLLKQQVMNSIRGLRWTEFVVWVNNSANRVILPLPGTTQMIYDITDDWAESTMPRRVLNRLIDDDRWLLENSDDVIVCSPKLQETKAGKCTRLSLIRNGIDTHRYAPEQLTKLQIPADITFGAPVAGYIGTLHEDRLDVALLKEVAERLPNVHFVLVGPNALSTESMQLLSSQANCHVLGGRPHETMPAYFAGIDVCITPHRVTPFTESLDPLKLYEYMATGKPIVSTGCAGFRELSNMIEVANSPQEFASAISKVLASPDDGTLRVQWASKESWESRFDEIEAILRWKQ